MHNEGRPIRRQVDGTIDYASYRVDAARQRAEAIRMFGLALSTGLAKKLRTPGPVCRSVFRSLARGILQVGHAARP